MYCRGEVVIDKKDCDSKGEPTGKKLWICEKKWVPLTTEHKEAFSYSVKDGPGEDAKDMGWRWEGDLLDWVPPKE